ncbi:MAG: BrnT family toxin [Rickettsiales bacterium]|jgi:uncharacterized DUF497 family protein|nr:BrnT family toxin [Rickettsiales bacterium]
MEKVYEFENFEWDDDKQAITKSLRNLDFADSWIIFSDENAITFQSDRDNEIRFKTIGKLEEKLIAVIHTQRENNARIISMRRAHKDEEEAYYDN